MKKTKKKIIVPELTEEEMNDLVQDLLKDACDLR